MKKMLYVIVPIILIISFIGGFLYYKNEQDKKEKARIERERKEKIEEITSYYGNYVKTNDLIVLYNSTEEEIGKINTELELEEIEINENTKYFKVKDKDWYVKYNDVIQIEKLTEVDTWYKNYVVFNQNAVTKEVTNLYNDNNLEYTINEGMSLPIYIKETDRYYVEYNDKLLYVLKSEVEVVNSNNTSEKTRSWIRPIVYHAIYDPKTEKCNTIICHTETQFDSHMGYLSKNGYFTLKMKDLELFLQGKIRIPEKSAIITIDDGFFGLRAIPILEKNKVTATMFLITSEYDPDDFRSEYLELHSHGHDLHKQYVCPGPQGGGIKCLPEATIQADLKKSSEILGGSKVFCYPFYEYNDYSRTQLIKAGYKMAFIGAAGVGGIAYQNSTDLYKIPRMTMSSTTTLNEFINYVK